MTTKREHSKTPIDKIWSGDNWSVIYGELRKGPGRSSSIKPLFQYVGEKIPFGALREVEKKLKELGVKKTGSIYRSRFNGNGKICRSGKYFYPSQGTYYFERQTKKGRKA